MLRKNDLSNIITDNSGTKQFSCSAGPIRFVPISKSETASKDIGKYLNGIYSSIKVRLFEIINYIPKIV